MGHKVYACPCGNKLIEVKQQVVITKCRVWGADWIECNSCKQHLPYPVWLPWRPRSIA